MTSILVVCSGNICRSPVAEGLLRRGVQRRFGSDAPEVSSAGTIGLEGSSATPESVQAAAERGVDISSHVARRLTDADDPAGRSPRVHGRRSTARRSRTRLPAALDRTFTLKELARLLEHDAPAAPLSGDALGARIAAAATARRGGAQTNPYDEDIVDPLGMPLETYRAIAWELDEWIDRLLAGLFGPVPAGVAGEGP